jgi:hypothetical protein
MGLEAAAIAVPEPRFGEVVGVFLVRDRKAGVHANLDGRIVREWVVSKMNPQAGRSFS